MACCRSVDTAQLPVSVQTCSEETEISTFGRHCQYMPDAFDYPLQSPQVIRGKRQLTRAIDPVTLGL